MEPGYDPIESAKEVFDRVLPMLKKQNQHKDMLDLAMMYGHHKHEDPLEKMEKFTPVYCDSVHQLMRIKPHSDTEYFPAKLFKNLSPHRKDQEAEWIKNNYEPVTQPIWIDFQNTIKRGIDRGNYSIVWPEQWPAEYDKEDTMNPRQYLEDGIKLFGSIQTWFSNQLPDIKIKDANGVTAVQPYKMNFVETEEGVVTSDDMVEPIPVYYSSDKILAFEEDEYYLLLSEEKSMVEYGGKMENSGYVLYFFDKNTITRIYQTGKKIDWTFTIMTYLEHNWEAVPVWKHKGQPEMKGRHIYFQSPFDFAVGNLNLVLKNQINKQMAEANCAWPHRIMVADRCDHVGEDSQKCLNGKIVLNGQIMPCPSCHGTGMKDKPSPGSTLLVYENEMTENGPGMDRLRFVSPDPAILKHLEETISKNEVKARDILHIYSTNSEATGADPTATGKWIDLKSMYAFIRPIIDELFDIYEGVIQAIIHMRYGDLPDKVTIIRPVNLDYQTSADYLAEYTALLEKGVPPVITYKVLEKYVQSMFYSSEQDRKVWKLVLAADPVVSYKNEDIRNMVGGGTVAKWQAVLHTGIFMFINELLAEDKEFLDKDFEVQKEALYKKAQDAANEMQPTMNANPFINGLVPNRAANPGQANAA